MSESPKTKTDPGDKEQSSPKADDGPGPVPDKALAARIEAALISTDRPLAAAKLSDLFGKPGSKAIHAAVDKLNLQYRKTKRSFKIEEVAGGYQVMTLAEFGPVIASLHKTRDQSRLSPAALETLAIVAYKQPTLRAEIEAIRGVSCGEMLRSLMERHLVKIVGRAEEIGRPMLYGTTKSFLEVFGLVSLKDLPKVRELRQGSAENAENAE
jgi:segregation and condensation protein B